MLQVASYCRVSTDKEDQANSFASQKKYFQEYIARHPEWELYEIYADEGVTGTSTKKRTQFNRMINDAYSGKFQLILTKEISRFSRNILDTISYTRKLKEIGVGVMFMTENLNSLHPESEMLLTFMGTIAQEESRRTSVRVKWGQTRRMENGVVFGRSMLGYNVKEGKITLDPKGAEVVRLIYQKYGEEKKGAAAIARELETEGYLTFMGNQHWSPGQVIKILKNEKYAGDLIQKKMITPNYLTHAKKKNCGEEELVILRGHHEPIIQRELWNAVQQELQARNKHNRKQTGHSGQYAFSGKIRCGECGASFVVRWRRRNDGTKMMRWRCYTAVTRGTDYGRGCGVGRLIAEEDAIDMMNAIISELNIDREQIIKDVATLAAEGILQGETGNQEASKSIERELLLLEKKRKKLMDAYFAEEISREDMLFWKLTYEAELADLFRRKHQAEEREKGETTQEEILLSTSELLMPVLTGKETSDCVIKNILESIYVYKDRDIEVRLQNLPQIFRFSR